MQIVMTRSGETKIKLTRTEQGVLHKAAKIMERIKLNIHDVKDSEVVESLESAAKVYGPAEGDDAE